MCDLALLARGIHPYRTITRPRRLNILALAPGRRQAANILGRKLFLASEMPGALSDVPLIPPDEVTVDWHKVGFRVPMAAHTPYADLTFGWADADEEWKRFQGFNADAIYLDEDAGNANLMRELFMRGLTLRGKGDGVEPWAGGITWSATPTCGTEAYITFRKYTQENNPATSYFFIPAGENPAISAQALTDARKFLGEKHAQVRIDGTRDATELLQVYGEQWRDSRHMLAADRVISPLDNLWLSYDPGVEHPTGLALFAIAPAPHNPIRLELVKLWNHARQTVDYDVECLDRFLCGRRLAGVIYDTAAKATNRAGPSVIGYMQDKMLERGMLPFCGFHHAYKSHWPGIQAVRHYLSPDPLDDTAPTLIGISPSVESGGQLAREQMLKYRGKEATRFTGEGGVVKKDDEFPDCLRYICIHRPAYNSAWACGDPTRVIVSPTQSPQILPPVPAALPSDPYLRHLAMSKNRRASRASSWTTVDF
jgi:hypothetical protein